LAWRPGGGGGVGGVEIENFGGSSFFNHPSRKFLGHFYGIIYQKNPQLKPIGTLFVQIG